MNALLDDSLVGLVLSACCLYALAKLGPTAARRRVLALLARLLVRAPTGSRLHSAALRLAQAAADEAPGACGGCDNCQSEDRPRASAEIGVPIAAIPRARPPRWRDTG